VSRRATVDGSRLLECARELPIICGKAVSCTNILLAACATSSLVEDAFCGADRGSGETLGSKYVVEED
jgi:hypothetical protein